MLLTKETHPALFDLIATFCGESSGVSFRLPDVYRDSVPNLEIVCARLTRETRLLVCNGRRIPGLSELSAMLSQFKIVYDTRVWTVGEIRELLKDKPDDMRLYFNERTNDDTLVVNEIFVGTLFDKDEKWLIVQLVK